MIELHFSHLLRSVMGRGYEDATGTLRVHVASLRKKLEADPARPIIILTEPGIGGKDHVGKFWLGFDQENRAVELRQLSLQAFPLLLGHGDFGAAKLRLAIEAKVEDITGADGKTLLPGCALRWIDDRKISGASERSVFSAFAHMDFPRPVAPFATHGQKAEGRVLIPVSRASDGLWEPRVAGNA